MAEFNVREIPYFPTDPSADGVNCSEKLFPFFQTLPAGSVVYFPPGTYRVKSRIAQLDQSKPSITIRGDGPDSSIILIDDACEDYAIVEVKGEPTATNNWFRMQDIRFRGSETMSTQPLRSDSILSLICCSNVRLDRVDFFRLKGMGLLAQGLRNSVLRDVHFRVLHGMTKPQMLIEHQLASTHYSKNLTFESCQWENNNGDSHAILTRVENAVFSGCKFHGSVWDDPLSFKAHLYLDQCYLTSVLDSRFTASDVELIFANLCNGVLVSGSVFDDAYQTDDIQPNKCNIRLHNSGYSVVTGNFFGSKPLGKTVLPVYPVPGTGSTNIVSENTNLP